MIDSESTGEVRQQQDAFAAVFSEKMRKTPRELSRSRRTTTQALLITNLAEIRVVSSFVA